MKKTMRLSNVVQLSQRLFLVAFLLLGCLGAKATDREYFKESDLKLSFQKDESFPANNRLVIQFLAHHGTDNDGWRSDEKGGKFYLIDTDGTEYYLGKFTHDGDYATGFHFSAAENSIGFEYVKDYQYSVDACRTDGKALEPGDHSCKSSHYTYTKLYFKIPQKYLNKTIKIRIEGTYWRYGWSASGIDQDVEFTKSISFPYNYTLGDISLSKSASFSGNNDPGFSISKDGKLTVYWKVLRGGNITDQATFKKTVKKEKWGYNKNTGKYDFIPEYNNTTSINTPLSLSADVSDNFYLEGVSLQKYHVSVSTNLSYSGNKIMSYSKLYGGTVSKTQTIHYYGLPYLTSLRTKFTMYDPAVNNGIAIGKNIKLDWTTYNMPSVTESTDYRWQGKWVILRKNEKGYIEYLGSVPLSTTTYTDRTIDYDTQYRYIVAYQYNDWDMDLTEYVPSLSKLSSYVSTKRAMNLNMTTDIQDRRIDFNLNFTPSKVDNLTRLYVYRTRPNEIDQILVNNVALDANQTTYSFSDVYSTTNMLDYSVGHQYIVELQQNLGGDDIGSVIVSKEVSAAVTGGTTIKSLTATRGTYGTQVKLNWDANRSESKTIDDVYLISRRMAGTNDAFERLDKVAIKENHYTYTDDTAMPGNYYEYRVGVVGQSGQESDITSDANIVAFAKSTGTVTGHINYTQGTSVSDVTMMINQAENSQMSNQFYSLELDGGSAQIDMDSALVANLFGKDANFSIQMWVKPNPTETKSYGVFNVLNKFCLEFAHTAGNDYATPLVVINGSARTYPAIKIPTTEWTHVTLSRNGSAFTMSLTDLEGNTTSTPLNSVSGACVANASAIISTFKANRQSLFLLGAGRSSSVPFKGKMDEIRLWSRSLTAKEITNNHDHMLVGNELGLECYLPVDENLVGHIFDSSTGTNIAHSNHGVLVENVKPSEDIPSSFALKGVTDEYGNYSIAGVPCSRAGVTYNITPVYGTHEFQPTQTQVTMSDQVPVANNQDFTDISSFKVSGKVTYKYGSFPVEGATVYVDGEKATVDGEEVKTDAYGEYIVDVPIGSHFISIKKDYHEFTYNGRFPHEAGQYYDFQENTKDVDFTDETLVTIVGRLSGGQAQAEIPVGFGVDSGSKALIGQGTIYLEPVSDMAYQINSSETANVVIPNNDDKVNSTTTLLKYDRTDRPQIRIQTDPKSGEYKALLPPMNYRVVSASTASVSNDMLNINQIPQIKPELGTLLEDSLITNTSVATSSYHAKNIITYEAEPSITLADLGNQDGALGESAFKWQKVEYPLYEGDGEGGFDYRLGYPVFESSKRYRLSFKAVQTYFNLDNSSTPVETKIPMSGLKVSFSGSSWKNASDESADEITLNDKGVGVYSFVGTTPSYDEENGSKLPLLQASYMLNGRTYVYPDTPIAAIFTGCEMYGGQGFVTGGPDVVEFVLRDPPGSNSYAYVEKGSTFTSTASISNEDTHTDQQNLEFGAGVNFTWDGAGLTGEDVELEVLATLNESFEWTDSNIDSKTVSSTTELTRNISTSDSEDFVGSEGDVFVGKGTNMAYGLAHKVGFFTELPEDDETSYQVLASRDGNSSIYFYDTDVTSAGLFYSTQFAYTAKHIEETLLPELDRLRKALLLPKGTDEKKLTWNANEVTKYISLVDKTNRNYGSEEHDASGQPKYYKIVTNPNLTLSNTNYVDRYYFYSNAINVWQQHLKQNEQHKVMAKYNKDVSFSVGANYEEAKTLTSNVSTEHTYVDSYSYSCVAGVDFSIAFGVAIQAKINGGGGNGETTEVTDTEEEETSLQFGYVLSDADANNYFSVSVAEPDSINGFCFHLNAGRSSCPYEGPETTKWYMPGHYSISSGTTQLDMPKLTVDRPNISDIPAGKEAVMVVNLTNNSPAHVDRTYYLSYDDTTNPNGLVMTIDGLPITSQGRAFTVGADQTLQKTMKIAQSRTDVLDYENINLILTPECMLDSDEQYPTLTSEQSFSIHFKPSCSDATMKVRSVRDMSEIGTLNIASGDSLILEATDFDKNFKGFVRINLQQKGEYETAWSTVASYALNDSIAKADNIDHIVPANASTIQFIYDMHDQADQAFQFRVQTVGRYGTEYVTNESEPVTVIKDTSAPMALGQPTPVNGILTPDGEISLMFNEEIYKSRIVNSNIEVKGVLNGQELTHDTGLKFSNGQVASTEASISLSNMPFAVEMWVNRPLNEAATLFTHGNGDDALSIGFTTDNKLQVKLNGETFTSSNAVQTTDWQYLSVTYNSETQRLNAYSLYNDTYGRPVNATLFGPSGVTTEQPYEGVGRIALGANYTGMMQELTIWNNVRSLADMADKSTSKTGRETGLIANWPMNECQGTLAADKARSRNLLLPAESYWYVSDKNLAASFNGVNDKLQMSIMNTPITSKDDYTLEFQFHTDQPAGTIISCGDGVLDEDTNGALSVALVDGKLNLKANGETYLLSSNTVNDNQWHHFVLNVRRNASAIIYIDGVVARQLPSSALTGLVQGGAAMVLGADIYYDASLTENITDYFKGELDEVRLWKASMTKESIMLNSNARLSGTEKGLALYYPFEKKQVITGTGVYETVASTEDRCGRNTQAAVGNFTSTAVAPMLKGVRQRESVYHTWVASDNKIVINIQEPVSNIEGCTLEFAVDYIQDLNGNTIPAPITWTTFVDINRLQWSDTELNLVTEQLQPTSATVTITNQSSKEEVWTLSGLPAWLEASPSQGTLKQLASQTITFTTAESTPIGSYEGVVYLTGNNSVDEPLYVSLNVTGDVPDWSVDPKEYELNMNVIGQLQINGLYTEDTNDMVAAFDGTKCVGVCHPTYNSRYDSFFTMLTIYGNADGNPITLKAYDASTGTIYPVVAATLDGAAQDIVFQQNNLIGTTRKPLLINAQEKIQQDIALRNGWTWISLYTIPENPDIKTLVDDVEANIKTIKNRNAYIQHTGSLWGGELSTMEIGKMYKVHADNDVTFSVVGASIKPSAAPITINKGWNWIGFNSSIHMNVTEAFADLNPTDGDIVKSQNSFAYYDQNEWIGSLNTMTAGMGYYYQSNAAGPKTFCYPTVTMASASKKVRRNVETFQTNGYEGNMSMMAVVMDGDRVIEDAEISVFVDTDLRGFSAGAIKDNIHFLTIGGKSSNDVLRFMVTIDGESYMLDQHINYQNDGVQGSMKDPYVLQMDGTTNISNLRDADELAGTLYDLVGRKLNKANMKGVYIQNGTKVVK